MRLLGISCVTSGMKLSAKSQPIIIGGFYRSGTTLLRRLLDSHSSIFCGPEIKFFKDFFGDYLHDELKHVRFFSTVRSLALHEDELLGAFGDGYVNCLDLAAKKAGKRRWADKNPENVLYLQQWQTVLKGHFHFVFVVRHPLDSLASLCEVGFEKTVPKEFSGKVEIYRKFIEAGLKFIKENPGQCSLVRYEDLVNNPKETLCSLLGDIDEQFENGMLEDFYKTSRRTGIEDPKIRLTTKVHSESVGRWRADLSKAQVEEAVNRLSSEFNSLGYAIPTLG